MFLVAGASGRSGGFIAAALLAEGRRVRVFVRDARQADAWRARGAEVHVGSLDDSAALASALADVEAFYALVPEDAAVSNFRVHRRRIVKAIASAVKTRSVPHVVLLSAAAAVLSDHNGPAAELHEAECALGEATRRLTTLRPSAFQENALAVLGACVHEGVYPNFLPTADLAVPLVATRDVARVALRCLLEAPTKSEVIDVVGPTYSARQVAAKLGEALGGKPLSVVDVPPHRHVSVLTRAGLPAEFAHSVAELYACFAAGRVAPAGGRTVFGSTTLEQTFASGIEAALDAVRRSPPGSSEAHRARTGAQP